jgi:hypothetical protein
MYTTTQHFGIAVIILNWRLNTNASGYRLKLIIVGIKSSRLIIMRVSNSVETGYTSEKVVAVVAAVTCVRYCKLSSKVWRH